VDFRRLSRITNPPVGQDFARNGPFALGSRMRGASGVYTLSEHPSQGPRWHHWQALSQTEYSVTHFHWSDALVASFEEDDCTPFLLLAVLVTYSSTIDLLNSLLVI
jgi:hypothetical protein